MPSGLRPFAKRGIGHVSVPISSWPTFDRPNVKWSIALKEWLEVRTPYALDIRSVSFDGLELCPRAVCVSQSRKTLRSYFDVTVNSAGKVETLKVATVIDP